MTAACPSIKAQKVAERSCQESVAPAILIARHRKVKGKHKQEEAERLRKMRDKIDEIERLVLDLRELGEGMPVIEKNTCSILGVIYVLEFGISDVAEITDKERGY